MIRRSFLHIPSIGASTEQKIWKNNILTMEDFVDNSPGFLSESKKSFIRNYIKISFEKFAQKDPFYFAENLPSKEHWRLFNEYRDDLAYLDIETTGLGSAEDIITTIALYDGKDIKYYINGKNLYDFCNDIKKYKMIITYNGKCFDLPFIETFFNIKTDFVHLDLRFILKSLGVSGGLKSCERKLGIGRTGGSEDLDGFFAVLLWNDYKKTKNLKSLETLLAYNIEDVLNLEYLMFYSYNKKMEELGFKSFSLDYPEKPENPFKADIDTIERIKSHAYFGYNRF